MSKELWYSLGIKEQMSNIHGEVVRMVRARNNYTSGKASEDRSKSYLNKIHDLIIMTYEDPKNFKENRNLLMKKMSLRDG